MRGLVITPILPSKSPFLGHQCQPKKDTFAAGGNDERVKESKRNEPQGKTKGDPKGSSKGYPTASAHLHESTAKEGHSALCYYYQTKCSSPKAQETSLRYRLVVVFPDGGLEAVIHLRSICVPSEPIFLYPENCVLVNSPCIAHRSAFLFWYVQPLENRIGGLCYVQQVRPLSQITTDSTSSKH